MYLNSYKRKPQSFCDVISKNNSSIALFFTLSARWNQIVGERLSLVSSPAMVLGNNLVVNVKNSTWLQEISFFKGEILANIRKNTNSKSIIDIVFKQGQINQRNAEPNFVVTKTNPINHVKLDNSEPGAKVH